MQIKINLKGKINLKIKLLIANNLVINRSKHETYTIMIKHKLIYLSLGLFICFNSQGQQVLTLEKVMAIAYENSPNLKKSELSLIRSQASLAAQRAAMKSRFAFDTDPVRFTNVRSYDDFAQEWYTNTKLESNGTFSIVQPIVATDGTVSLSNTLGWQSSKVDNKNSKDAFSNNLQLRIDQPIFTYNKKKMDLTQLELDLENTSLSYALQKLNIEKQTTQYFYNLYQKQKSLSIAQEELENQKTSHTIIKNMVDAGLSAEEEFWQAELNLANAQSNVYNAEVSMANAEDQLKQTVGMSLEASLVILANVETKPIDIPLADAITYAKKQRMELRQSQINIENSQFDLITARATNEFKGNVSMAVGLFGDNEKLGKVYSSESMQDNESVALSFQVPIFDWGERDARIRAAEANLKSSELDMSNEYIDIEMNIRQVYRNLKNLLIQIQIAEKSVENAIRTYDLNLEKYKNGDLTSMDLSRYQEQLSSEKNNLTNSIIDYKLELLNMKIQTLWDFEKGESIAPIIDLKIKY